MKIKFIKEKKEATVTSGCEILEIFRKHPDLPLKFGCKRGECGTCAIKILNGMQNLTKLSTQEEATLRKKDAINRID